MTTLPSSLLDSLASRLVTAPVAATTARPLHVLYGGAHLFKAGSPQKLGQIARDSFARYAADKAWFGRFCGVEEDAAEELWARVHARLEAMPIASMCIDFEDGYGPRPDAEEDAEAVRAATELGTLDALDARRPRIGIRVKALAGATVRRALRTLDLFLTTMGTIPEGFSVTLPKVSRPDEVLALDEVLGALESKLGLGRIPVELMIETPHALFALPKLLAASDRIACIHLGAYDLTAELGVTASDQRLDHPYCDVARMIMQATVAGSTVAVADGATTELPIAAKDAAPEKATDDIRAAWSLHQNNVRRAIEVGIWQGWDLHPAQLPARYGTVFGFFLQHRAAMAARLGGFVEKATQATRMGGTFDDAATGQGLLGFFLRGLACGALDDADLARTGLTRVELAGRSFAAIVAARTGP